MIRRNETIAAATVNKPHGIHGEMSVTVDPDITLGEGSCVITEVDGILTPFFIRSIRPRRADTFLITLEGVDDERAAAAFTGATLFVPAATLRCAPSDKDGEEEEDDEEKDDEGFYASMLIDSTLVDTDGTVIGTIADIDTSTPNTLLIVDRPDGTGAMIPLAPDLIAGYDTENCRLTMSIPDGLLDL